MSSTGAQYLGGLLSGDYQLLRVATPADWHVRLPGMRAGPHCQRIQNLMIKARALRMSIVLVGPPGLARHASATLPLRSDARPFESFAERFAFAGGSHLHAHPHQTAGGPAQRAEH
eukprot:4255809-Pyramimonas_sp.AAC.1